jgi:hypothetical protein
LWRRADSARDAATSLWSKRTSLRVAKQALVASAATGSSRCILMVIGSR